MDQNPPKPSLLSAVSLEAIIVIISLIIIVITLNYFNVIGLSDTIKFLPHQEIKPISEQASPKSTAQIDPNKCAPLPKTASTKIETPSATLSSELAMFSGFWKGKWNDSAPAVLIVSKIGPNKVAGRYFFKGKRRLVTFNVTPENKLVAPIGDLTWEMGVDGNMHGTFTNEGKVTSTIVMTRCTP